jgi:hypothetical protein
MELDEFDEEEEKEKPTEEEILMAVWRENEDAKFEALRS